MKVAIDATPLMLSSGGVTRYAEQLSTALAGEFPEDDFVLLCDHAFRMPAEPLAGRRGASGAEVLLDCDRQHVQSPVTGEAPRNLRAGGPPAFRFRKHWWTVGVQRAMSWEGCDLFHGTSFLVPWLPVRPSVVTLHDLSPWMERKWHPRSGFVRWRTPFQLGLGLAEMLITPSEVVRRQAIERFRVHPGRVVTVPLAAAAHFRQVDGRPRSAPYFVFVGTLEPRKNLGTLLAAWREVRRTHAVDLVLVGRIRADIDVSLQAEPGLQVLGEVADAELPALYSAAVAVLYPSFYEGFGLPVLEALQCGALVIASRDPAICEVAGDAALLLEPLDVRAWAQAMEASVAAPESLATFRGRSLGRAKLFSWRRAARATREVYMEALRRSKG
jgi:glycosyltransferase involved in cell wall biosynthesis